MKRGTEDLDFFIGDEAIAAASGPGKVEMVLGRGGNCTDCSRLWATLSDPARAN